MNLPETNLLGLENPQEYLCRVENYVIGHSEADIFIEHSTKPERFYVNFRHVLCFSGMMRWRGADLRIAPDKEYLEFMRQIVPQLNMPDKELLDETSYGRLYVFEGYNGLIRLVATDHEKIPKLP